MPDPVTNSEGIFGFDPRTIANCAFWFDGSDSNTISTFNSTVSEWRDKSSNNRHATQTNAGNRPTSSGNGIVFNGSSQFLQIPRAAGVLANTPFAIFIVERLNSTSNGLYLFGDQNVNNSGASQSSLHIGYRSTANLTFAFYGSDLEITGLSGTGAIRVWCFILPQAGQDTPFSGRSVRLNGTTVGSFSSTAFLLAFTAPVIGQSFNGNYYIGSIFEIIGYTGQLTINQVQQLEGYLAWKWGVQTNLPATHPFRNSRPLVRVFQPTDIANCALWLDGKDPSVFTFSSGSNVSNWRDKSSSGANAVSYVYGNGTLIWDGQSVIFFNNLSTAFSATNNAFMQLDRNIQTTADYTVLAVVLGSNGVAGNSQRIMAIYANARNPLPYAAGQLDNRAPNFGYGNSFEFSYLNPGTNNASTDYTPANETIQLLSMTSGPSNLVFHQNGALYSNIVRTWPRFSVDGNLLPSIGGTRITASNAAYDNRYFNGRIYELLVYNQALSDNDRKLVEGYLSSKYNIGQYVGGASATATVALTPNDASISPNLRIWNDATDLTGGTTLTTWTNKGDNTITLTCTGSPSVVANQLNGQNIVRFTTSQTWGNTAVNYSAYTIFCVSRQTGGTNGRILRSSTNNQLYGYWNGFKRAIYVDGNPDWLRTAPSDTRWDIVSAVRTASGPWALYFNGAVVIGASSSVATNLTGININGSEPSACEVAEILVYNAVLTPAQIRGINIYLSNKWALTLDNISLPYSYQVNATAPSLISPQQIFPGTLVLWLDASQETYADGATVTSATDRSGSGYSVVPVSGNTIIYNQRGLNGMSVYNFGANRMQIANFVWRTKFTIAFVVRSNVGNFLFSQWVSDYTNYVFTGNCALIMVNSNGIAFIDPVAGSCSPISGMAANWVIVVMQYGNVGNPPWRLNGNGRTTTTSSGVRQGVTNVTATAFINGNGNNQFDTSLVAEILFFNDYLNTLQIQQLEGYLAWKWGLKNNLPTTHPYYRFAPSSIVSSPIVATGGDFVVNANGFTYHVFTQSGTFSITSGTGTFNYLLVGGGGGGGDRHGGGGGAGGVKYGQFNRGFFPSNFSIVVGGGGAAGNYESGGLSPAGIGGKGGDSSITGGVGIDTAYGGIGGGTVDGNPNTGSTPFYGSGGGGGGNGWSGVPANTVGGNQLVNAGGAGLNPGGGGGGGAGTAGTGANTSTGGNGTPFFSPHLLACGYGSIFATSPQSPISGGIAYIAAGGGGAANSATAPTARAGGLGGGGTGDWDDAVITAGTANTGSGGGASRSSNTATTGRAGGSGLVLIWY